MGEKRVSFVPPIEKNVSESHPLLSLPIHSHQPPAGVLFVARIATLVEGGPCSLRVKVREEAISNEAAEVQVAVLRPGNASENVVRSLTRNRAASPLPLPQPPHAANPAHFPPSFVPSNST